MNIYNWFSNERKKRTTIPILTETGKVYQIPIHISRVGKIKLNKTIVDCLGGIDNIESYRSIPNSRKIRVTLINPNLIDKRSLEQLDTQLFMRIGKKIVHIIP